ncbi:DHH family phosphoesterase [uncultured Tyzzerella sp.]|uniref:DHH family phosphoesterase n=1 Tax=uncultured Tyzzerella sp. TaxID=2321398 RepID=UPI002942B0C4|nr:DHH family phosphoesterase [uncultured Tyzzerella sp.]
MKNFDNIPFSALKIAPDGMFVSYNIAFEKNIIPYIEEKANIKDIIEDFNFNKEEQQVIINQIGYNVLLRKNEQNYDLFFSEIKTLDKDKTTVGLLVIDSYDEVLDSLEEFRHPLILAIVDRKIKKMAKDLGGVVKKFEKDKYIIILSQEGLEELKENKFDILDSIREIDMGNTIPVTLSIGIGKNGENLDENMEFARVSLDLALSRGGDQVIIKDGENYQFFGGHSKEGNRNSRVRARVKAYALTELIEDASNVIIMGHRHTDLDCMGAGIGVYSIVSALDKSCKIVLNDITSSVSYLYDRVIKDEKYKDVFVSSEEALKLVNRKTLLIIVDVYKQGLCECPELVDKVKKIVVFDHHRKGTDYIENAVLTYHETYASSTCELITEMLMYINKNIPIKQVEADSILAGIIVDTKNFAFKTGIKTFEAAAFLKKKGADTIRVKKLFKNSIESYNARANVVSNMKLYREDMAIAVLENEIDNPLLVVAQACDELLNIDNINASFVLCKVNNGISISARSFGEVNVQIIMEKLGGGGHQSISATQIKDVTVDEAMDMLKGAIDEYFKEEE